MLPRILLTGSLTRGRGRLVRSVGGRCLVFRAREEEIWRVLREEPIDVVLALAKDLAPDPAAFVRAVRAAPHPPEIVVVTTAAAGDLLAAGATIVDAALPAGTQADILDLALRRAIRSSRTLPLPHSTTYAGSLRELGTTSRAIRGLHDEARRAAAGESPILVRGEPGVGMSRLAEVLHAESPRARGAFQRFSLAAADTVAAEAMLFGHAPGALPGRTRATRGLFELAHNGSLFLEHADRASPEIQAKLVAVLQTRLFRPLGADRDVAVNVRLIATIQLRADNAQPSGGATLLADLRRLFGLTDLLLPPLRQRPVDIPELAAAALERYRHAGETTVDDISDAALDALSRHTWPGNIAELRAVVERAALLARGDTIQLQDLPPDLLAEGGGGQRGLHIEAPWLADSSKLPRLRSARSAALDVVDRAYLDRLLRATRGRVGDAARRADIDPRSLNGLMRRHGLRKKDFKLPPRSAGA